jgi:adenylate kinase family enzyme
MFLGGESGTSKTTLARHMSNWWKETAFASDIPHFQAIDDLQAWIESRKAFEELSDHKKGST